MDQKNITIYIDESGIHKQSGHSTFALVYIEFKDLQSMEKRILEIEKKHGINNFHWRSVPWKLREAFISEAEQLPFTVKVAVFRNPIHPHSAMMSAIQHTLVDQEFKKIVIDGDKPKWFERQIKKNLRDRRIKTKKLKTVKSSSSPAIRLADAMAGLTRMRYDKKTKRAEELWKKMRKKITTQILLGGQGDE